MSASGSQEEQVEQLVEKIYGIHEIALSDSGGMEGMRDEGLLHAAVARPFVSFDGADMYVDDFMKAAALFHSLIKNHPFLDGTKRTAFLSAIYFLENRGYHLPVYYPEDEVIRFCLAVAEENAQQFQNSAFQRITVAEIATWFRHLLASPDPT